MRNINMSPRRPTICHLGMVGMPGASFVFPIADDHARSRSRRASPGRFFAATELKSMLAHIVVTYDIKLEDDTPRPRARASTLPDLSAKVVFRRRIN